MTVLEVLVFGTAVQLSAGIVVVINVVLSRLEQPAMQTDRGE